MKVSIVTACFNRVSTISDTISSVLTQDYPEIAYIVVDGGSTDGSREIIESFSKSISHYVSEPDKGMYDAINKGLQLATGDIIGLLHSDDVLYSPKVISEIVEAFKSHPSIAGLYSDGIYVSNDAEERIIRNRVCKPYTLARIQRGWLPLHPTVYLRRELIAKYGAYDLNYQIASDTDFLLRYLYKHRIQLYYLNRYVVKMRIGGASTNIKDAWRILKEDMRIYHHHGLNPISTVLLKKFYALKQYFGKN